MSKRLDLITIGRFSVDLYGAQIGGLLEDMASFNKYVGGSHHQYRNRNGTAGPQIGAHHPGRR